MDQNPRNQGKYKCYIFLEEKCNFLHKGAVMTSQGGSYNILKFKGNIIWGLTQFFVQDFVPPENCIMSERFWFFTLKMTIQALGNVDFPDR